MIDTEELIPLTEFPDHVADVCVASLYSFSKQGLLGIQLETVQGQYGKLTSIAALQRFRDAVAAKRNGAVVRGGPALLQLLRDPPQQHRTKAGWVQISYRELAAVLRMPRKQTAYYLVSRLIAHGAIERRSESGRLLLRAI